MAGSSRRCGTCRWFQDAGMGGTGWCTHPKRQLSSDVRILVRKNELACRNSWGDDYWESIEGAESVDPEATTPATPDPSWDTDAPLQASYDDEVTSVVDADIHRAQSQSDLDDRVVEQTSIVPEDEDVHDDGDDDRFGLLARGGRDSVHAARNRMLRRRDGQPDDAPRAASDEAEPEEVRFAPDDFVEEEAPSPSEPGPEEPKASPHDDVILNENIQQGSPRSRRLRRGRKQPSDPKGQALAGTNTDVPAQVPAPNAREFDDHDPFNTVPQVSSEIDLSQFRQTRRHEPDERTAPVQTEAAAPDGEDPYELAIRNANAIKAAARAERRERQRSSHRPRITPRSDGAATPEVQQEQSTDISELVQAAIDRESPRGLDDHHAPDPPMSRSRLSTRDFSDLDFAPDETRDVVEDEPHVSATRESRHEEIRDSWWRGFLPSAHKKDPGRMQVEYDESLYLDDWSDDDEYPISSQSDWGHDPFEGDDDPGIYAEWDDEFYTAVAEDTVDDSWSHPASERPYTEYPAVPSASFEPVDLQQDSGMDRLRNRLFGQQQHTTHVAREPQPTHRPPFGRTSQRSSSQPQSARAIPEDLLEYPEDAWYEPEPDDDFDIRDIVVHGTGLLDMTIQVSPDVPRNCASCRSYRQSEQGERGWCTNNWAFTHRQMVNANDLACQSTIGCWWLPADEEVWLTDDEPDRGRTPRIDRLIAHLDPLREAVGK